MSCHPFARFVAFSLAISFGSAQLGAQTEPATSSSPALPPSQSSDHPGEDSQALLNGIVFDQVWVIIRDTHPDPSINQGQWNETRLQLRDRAVAATDAESLRSVLRDMLDTLGESHFAIIPNSVAGSPGAVGGWSGMTLHVFGDEVVVTRIDPRSPAEVAGIKPGWVFVSSDGDPIAPLLKEFGAPRTSLERLARDSAVGAFIGGRPGMSPKYLLRDPAGVEHEVVITFEDLPGEQVKMGNLPPLAAQSKWGWLTMDEMTSAGGDPTKTGRVGYLTFSVWMTALSTIIDDALTEFRSADAVIIDLRGNPGGLGMMATGVAGHFLAEPTSLGTMQGRGMKLDFKSNPRTVDRAGKSIGVFTGPVAILMDGHTGSTSEIFAAGLLDVGRAQPFGQTSAGAALPATTHNLKNGDVLLHAIGDFKTPSGMLIEGRGVSQQVGSAPTRMDYTSCSNPELRDALRWIADERSKIQARLPTPQPAKQTSP